MMRNFDWKARGRWWRRSTAGGEEDEVQSLDPVRPGADTPPCEVRPFIPDLAALGVAGAARREENRRSGGARPQRLQAARDRIHGSRSRQSSAGTGCG
jgi:hypothetical protein